MNEKRIKKIVIASVIGVALVIGQIHTSATEADTRALSETEDTADVTDKEENITEIMDKEEKTTEVVAPSSKINEKIENSETKEEVSTDATTGNITIEPTIEKTTEIFSTEKTDIEKNTRDNFEDDKEIDDEKLVMDIEKLEALADYDEGLVYYLKKYANDSKAFYLEKYVDYLDKQAKVCEEMCALGEMTEAEAASIQAQCSFVKAELTVARNESLYFNLYLEKNELDYSDYAIEEAKDVHDIDYYTEKYPKKNYMTIARNVTDYYNAVAYMEAKKAEISALEKSISMMELLYEEGEISELELLEKKVSLEKAKYELVQYNIDRNIAYYSLEKICQ